MAERSAGYWAGLMSQENVEIVRRCLGGVGTPGMEALFVL